MFKCFLVAYLSIPKKLLLVILSGFYIMVLSIVFKVDVFKMILNSFNGRFILAVREGNKHRAVCFV